MLAHLLQAVKLVHAVQFAKHGSHIPDKFLNYAAGQTHKSGVAPLTNVTLHSEHAPVYGLQEMQSAEQSVHTLFPWLYWPTGQESSYTHLPETRA